MQTPKLIYTATFASACFFTATALAQHEEHVPDTADRPDHNASADQQHADPPPIETPPLPEGMTLDDVFGVAESPPPADFPDPVMDNSLYGFILFDQLEFRAREEGKDQLGWDAQAWLGYDYNRLWLKSEGEAVFDGLDSGESENDLLYSRLIGPFWYAQAGVQYANEWESGAYDERYSAVLALQGLAPGMFEIDASLYLSDDADLTASVEAEYDLRLTQRLVLQPRIELGFAAQDIPERQLGAGLTGVDLDLRLRYEITRKFAPYVGVGYSVLTGETADIAAATGADREQVFLTVGVRLAF